MCPITRTTARRATAAKAAKKIKILNEMDASMHHQHATKPNRFKTHATVPFGTSFANAQNKKKPATKTKDITKAKNLKIKAQAKKATLMANNKKTAGTDEQHRDARQHEEETERITREREREAYYQRRAARMVHSDKPMRFSWRTCHNMTNKKHPDSPIHSPIKAINLKSAFKHSQVISIHRSTRDAETFIRLTNVGQEEI